MRNDNKLVAACWIAALLGTTAAPAQSPSGTLPSDETMTCEQIAT